MSDDFPPKLPNIKPSREVLEFELLIAFQEQDWIYARNILQSAHDAGMDWHELYDLAVGGHERRRIRRPDPPDISFFTPTKD